MSKEDKVSCYILLLPIPHNDCVTFIRHGRFHSAPTALSHHLLLNLRKSAFSWCCETPTHPKQLRCDEPRGPRWDGEFRAQDLPGAITLCAYFGHKTAFIWEFLCEVHSLRLELFLEGKWQEARRVTWFPGHGGRTAMESESLGRFSRADGASASAFTVSASEGVLNLSTELQKCERKFRKDQPLCHPIFLDGKHLLQKSELQSLLRTPTELMQKTTLSGSAAQAPPFPLDVNGIFTLQEKL